MLPRGTAPWPAQARPGLYRRPSRPEEADLFALCLPDHPGPWIEALTPEATDERRARAARFRAPMDALRCLAAEALLWCAVEERHGLEPSDLATVRDAQGKPRFLHQAHLHFSLSHSGPWVLCALDHRPVGVDVELESPLRPGLIEASLSAEELRELQAAPEPARAGAFFRTWTLKESLLKAAGTGLGVDPRSIELGPDRQPLRGAPPAPEGCAWTLQPLVLVPGAWAALCCAR